MSNRIPDGWKIKLLKDTLSTIIAGQSPNRKDHAAKAGKYGILKTTAIDWGKYSPDKNQEVLDDFKVNPKHEVKAGDILITKAGPIHRVGVVTYVPKTPEKILVSGKMTLLRTGSAHDPLFLSYALATEYSQKPLKESTTGMASSQTNFTHDTLLDIPIWVPNSLPEQQKIASILSSVDDVIEKTREQIDKLKDLKTGMMQELLTKGIGHTEFKDSPVGRIPASWVVKTVGDLGSVVTGSTPKTASREYYGGSIPFISPSDINHSMYIRKTVNSLTEAGLKETRELPAGTVCVVCIGSTIGKTGITTFRCATNQQVNAVICRETHPEFVYYLLTYYSKVIKAEAGTQAVPIINKSSFSALPVQLPGYNEQVEIGNSIANVDSQTSLLESKLQSANSLKKALMQDLLTGKVRVKVDQKEPAVA